MFQTFSGNSRRPRQVNLSGQNANPFAATSWSPSPTGTQKTVEAAQQERKQRQQERERLNATKQVQRVWRGHRERRTVADERRQAFDNLNESHGAGATLILVQSFQLLMAFYSSKKKDDDLRLVGLCNGILRSDYTAFLSKNEIRPRLPYFLKILLDFLSMSRNDQVGTVLQLIVIVTNFGPGSFSVCPQIYYSTLSLLVERPAVLDSYKEKVAAAVSSPLKWNNEAHGHMNLKNLAYRAFALHFLTSRHLIKPNNILDDVVGYVDIDFLSDIIVKELQLAIPQLESTERLYLLTHLIGIHRRQRGTRQESAYLRALSILLSSCAGEILAQMDPQDHADSESILDEEGSSLAKQSVRLPPIVHDELSSLVNQESITGLLTRFNVDVNKGSDIMEADASLLANYALVLFRIFRQRGDEIRMWLFMGSVSTPNSADHLPAVKFFWQAMKSTPSFNAVTSDSKAALSLLRRHRTGTSSSQSVKDTDRDWSIILLFLEVYGFVLRFTDDEKFLYGANNHVVQQSKDTSGFGESALPLADIKMLTVFLKNLAFTMYYNASELINSEPLSRDGSVGGLSAYFGRATSTATDVGGKEDEISRTPSISEQPFAAITGISVEYVRRIVTGVMRMLYERDSRRRFLPKDHWLMTSRFDMGGFIPAVVLEEERQHQVRENEEEIEEDQPFEGTSIGTTDDRLRRRNVQMAALWRQQQKAARKKVLAAVGPRLEVLQNMPFVIPFETRVQIFRHFVLLDQSRRRNGHTDPDIWRMSMVQQAMAMRDPQSLLERHHAKIRRGRVFDDAFDQFYQLGEGLKEPIQITFVDKFDTVEAGIDGGGVTKEFLTSITNEAFRDSNGQGFFVTNDQNLLYPNPALLDQRRDLLRQSGIRELSAEWNAHIKEILMQYEFLGRVVGKCLYEGILIDVGFAGFFLLKWAVSAGSGSESGYRANINDLRELDESLYQGLLQLKNYQGNVEDFSLDFTIVDTVSLPGEPTRTMTRDLMPNGSSIAVNNENRPLYISCVARHRLLVQPHQQTAAFLRGLGDIINPSWLSMFNQAEIQTLIGGDASQIDVEDLRRNTAYGGVYVVGDDGREHPTIAAFWDLMHALDDADRRKVLKYVTSTPRAPLLGFAQLNPRFSIRDAGSDEARLPSTSTCVNLLKLPAYSRPSIMRQKLLYAVNAEAGFDLS